ncbi:hypothetical protein ABZ027_28145 [Streptomyces sp. NPDC006332]|uniref:hypothetical protein n=1 Tax=Streptomyces sp. NPDC006332 TaxID=3155456 RepID=UPI0033A02BAF
MGLRVSWRSSRSWRFCGAVLGFGVVWWWAVLRLVLSPDAGALEGTVAVGGWGLSLLPVHCVPKRRAAGAVAAGRWGRAWRVAGSAVVVPGGESEGGVDGRGEGRDCAGQDCEGGRG